MFFYNEEKVEVNQVFGKRDLFCNGWDYKCLMLLAMSVSRWKSKVDKVCIDEFRKNLHYEFSVKIGNIVYSDTWMALDALVAFLEGLCKSYECFSFKLERKLGQWTLLIYDNHNHNYYILIERKHYCAPCIIVRQERIFSAYEVSFLLKTFLLDPEVFRPKVIVVNHHQAENIIEEKLKSEIEKQGHNYISIDMLQIELLSKLVYIETLAKENRDHQFFIIKNFDMIGSNKLLGYKEERKRALNYLHQISEKYKLIIICMAVYPSSNRQFQPIFEYRRISEYGKFLKATAVSYTPYCIYEDEKGRDLRDMVKMQFRSHEGWNVEMPVYLPFKYEAKPVITGGFNESELPF